MAYDEAKKQLFIEYPNLFKRVELGILPLTIVECNAACREGQPFSRAYCSTDIHEDELYSFPYIFEKGHNILTECLIKNSQPGGKVEKLMLSKLLSFVLDKEAHRHLKRAAHKDDSKTMFAAAVGQHFFSKLTVNEKFWLDKCYTGKHMAGIGMCPCGCKEEFRGVYEDTSMGNPDCWHGSVDLLLNHSRVPVVLGLENPEEDVSSEDGGMTSIEVKLSPKINVDHLSQMIAQTIVFSFLQKNEHPEYDHFLIPSIGVAREQIVFHFYDAEKDILLQSDPMRFFWDSGNIDLRTVIATWFVINYKYLCLGIKPEIEKSVPKAQFFKHARHRLPLYNGSLQMGHVKKAKENKEIRGDLERAGKTWKHGNIDFFPSTSAGVGRSSEELRD